MLQELGRSYKKNEYERFRRSREIEETYAPVREAFEKFLLRYGKNKSKDILGEHGDIEKEQWCEVDVLMEKDKGVLGLLGIGNSTYMCIHIEGGRGKFSGISPDEHIPYRIITVRGQVTNSNGECQCKIGEISPLPQTGGDFPSNAEFNRLLSQAEYLREIAVNLSCENFTVIKEVID